MLSLKQQLDEARRYYQGIFLDQKWKFLTVLHDGWDGKGGLLGISTSFIHPETFTHELAPVGLREMKDHSGKTVAAEVSTLFETLFDVDVGSTVAFSNSDTNAAAKKASKLLTDEDEYGQQDCSMHVFNLVLEHSLGNKVRTRKKVLVINPRSNRRNNG